MDKKQTQSYVFGHEALPILFHKETTQFIRYMKEDANRFLKFWWGQVGAKLEDTRTTELETINAEVRELLDKKSTLIWVRMPPPKFNEEFYMMVFVKKPEFTFMVRWPSTRVFGLAKVPKSVSPTETFIYELTPRARTVPVKPGPQVSKEGFIQSVESIVWKKK